MEAVWRGGERVDFSASGGRVASFSTSVVAPSPIVLSQPALPAAGTNLVVQRGRDLSLAWSGGTVGELLVSLTASSGSSSVSALCTYPASAGAGVIPSGAIAHLPMGASNYSFGVSVRSLNQLTVGDAVITAQAMVNALTPGGDNPSRAVSPF